MTIATSSTAEFDITKIVRHAHITAGLVSVYQSVDGPHSAYARDTLDAIVKGLESEGIFAKSVSFETLTIAADQFKYDMPADVLDVFGTAMWIDPTQASTPDAANELQVAPILRDRWQTMTSKDAASRPFWYYCHREFSVPQVWLWPTPSATEAGGLVRFQVHRLRADATNGSNTMDFERYWTQFFIYELAHCLAVGAGKSLDLVNYLGASAADKKKYAKMYSFQRPDAQLTVPIYGFYRRRSF